jgi:2-polyprenyl-6-methoxyphenol hydroxylase-like FAD-dependent oxidoreductase
MQQQIRHQEETGRQTHEIKSVEQTNCCIVGGGPAGVVLAFLLARKGIRVTLLEAHMDFEREFRGDTLHPSVLEVLEEVGIVDRLLQLPHTQVRQFSLRTAGGMVSLAFSDLKTKYPYIAVISQARFLDFMVAEARNFPTFHLMMGAQVSELINEDGVVRGVRYHGQHGWHEVRAALTVGADGRFSRLRRLAGFEPVSTASPLDVLWFRLSHKEGDEQVGIGGRISAGRIVALIDRHDYWQVGYSIAKGGYQRIHADGLAALRQSLAEAVPEVADRVDELQDWKQISVLSVESSRLPRWYRPGLLLIGDAAHVMSPIGGVGINYAIQDAVVAANVLGKKLEAGTVQTSDLARVQRERELPTKVIQRMQTFLQEQIFARVLNADPDKPVKFPLLVGVALRTPGLRSVPTRLIAFGLRRVHVEEA